MQNYVISELYRTYHRKYPYVLMGAALIAGLLSYTISAPLIFIVCYYGLALIVNCVFSDEHSNHTLKNTVSFGYSRAQIFLGKYLAELLVSLSILPFAILPGILLFRPEHAGLMLTGALPLLIAGLAIANLVHFLIRGGLNAAAYWGIITFSPFLVGAILNAMFPGLNKVTDYFLFSQFFRLGVLDSPGQLWAPALVGVFWIAAATAAGLMFFCKKELK